MGGGFYSSSDRHIRVSAEGLYNKSADEIFTNNRMISKMDPKGVTMRESRDSKEHPESIAIILALDVTGSMGRIPEDLMRKGLPTLMQTILNEGIKDPQLLFLAIGDHECDDSPLQVGQFESSDELMDYWLKNVYIEGGGGGNSGESYSLAHYFAGYHTSIDCWEKRNQKGFLFTIGDEPTLKTYPKENIESIMGSEGMQVKSFSAVELLEKARETYNVYHLHLREGSNGKNEHVIEGWKQLIGDDLIVVNDKYSISKIIADKIVNELKNNQEVKSDKFFVDSESDRSDESNVTTGISHH